MPKNVQRFTVSVSTWDVATKKHVAQTATVEIDVRAVAQGMASRAAKNKEKTARALFGAVSVKLL